MSYLRGLLVLALLTSGAVAQLDPESALDTSPEKLDCAHMDSMKDRRPVFVGSGDGLRIGISTRKVVFAVGEPVIVDIWIDNRSSKPTSSGLRCPPYLHFGDVFDQSGHRLLGIRELALRNAGKDSADVVDVCASASIIIEIPAHTCKGPTETQGDGYTLDYNLPAGVYWIFPTRGADPALFRQGLMITVREP